MNLYNPRQESEEPIITYPISEVSYLGMWLKEATEGLCRPAKEMITAEMADHYVDAVQEHLAQGQPLVEAKRLAVADFGDAKSARRDFEKTYPSHYEFEHRSETVGWRLCLALFLWQSSFAANLETGSPAAALVANGLVALAAFLLICSLLPRPWLIESEPTRIFVAELFHSMAWVIFLWSLFPWASADAKPWVLAGALFCTVFYVSGLRALLRRKQQLERVLEWTARP